MPELPEVETVVRDLLENGLVGERIIDTRISWQRTLSGMTPRTFTRRIVGRCVVAVYRRGKYCVIQLDSDDWLLIHLRMTGSLTLVRAEIPVVAHERVALLLREGRELRFCDSRKFGRWVLTNDPSSVLGRLGPEPLDPGFTPQAFQERMRGSARMLKPLLLDQHRIAGLGNIYVDEALWEARLHPCRLANTLSPSGWKTLWTAIRLVLQRGIDACGTTLGNGMTNFYSVSGRRGRNQDGLNVFRRHGSPCPRCGTAIKRLIVAQRGTHVCPRCQRHDKRKASQ